MAVPTNQEILNKLKTSLAEILDTNTSSWSEAQRSQQQIQIRDLMDGIERYERKVAAESGRRIFGPVRLRSL